jgi:hypothetical protein
MPDKIRQNRGVDAKGGSNALKQNFATDSLKNIF